MLRGALEGHTWSSFSHTGCGPPDRSLQVETEIRSRTRIVASRNPHAHNTNCNYQSPIGIADAAVCRNAWAPTVFTEADALLSLEGPYLLLRSRQSKFTPARKDKSDTK